MMWVLDVAVKHVAQVIAHKTELEFVMLNAYLLQFLVEHIPYLHAVSVVALKEVFCVSGC